MITITTLIAIALSDWIPHAGKLEPHTCEHEHFHPNVSQVCFDVAESSFFCSISIYLFNFCFDIQFISSRNPFRMNKIYFNWAKRRKEEEHLDWSKAIYIPDSNRLSSDNIQKASTRKEQYSFFRMKCEPIRETFYSNKPNATYPANHRFEAGDKIKTIVFSHLFFFFICNSIRFCWSSQNRVADNWDILTTRVVPHCEWSQSYIRLRFDFIPFVRVSCAIYYSLQTNKRKSELHFRSTSNASCFLRSLFE